MVFPVSLFFSVKVLLSEDKVYTTGTDDPDYGLGGFDGVGDVVVSVGGIIGAFDSAPVKTVSSEPLESIVSYITAINSA